LTVRQAGQRTQIPMARPAMAARDGIRSARRISSTLSGSGMVQFRKLLRWPKGLCSHL
jgi:hypothetical protein